MDEEMRAPTLNNRLMIVGGMLTAIGAAVSVVGTSLVGAAMVSAVRQWAQSEQRRELMMKARQASTAAAQAWRGPREIVVPEAGSRVSVP